MRVGPSTQLSTEHEGEDACDVGLIGQRDQVEHQLHVIFEGIGNTNRPSQLGELGVGTLGLSQLNPALKRSVSLRDTVRLSHPIAHTDIALQVGEVVGHRVQNAAVPRRISATRSAVVPPSPNSRSNTTRGLFSIGCGVVGVRHETVFR